MFLRIWRLCYGFSLKLSIILIQKYLFSISLYLIEPFKWCFKFRLGSSIYPKCIGIIRARPKSQGTSTLNSSVILNAAKWKHYTTSWDNSNKMWLYSCKTIFKSLLLLPLLPYNVLICWKNVNKSEICLRSKTLHKSSSLTFCVRLLLVCGTYTMPS